MNSVINLIASALPCPLYANQSDDPGECAVYDLYTNTYDGRKRTVRLRVNLAAATMARALELETLLDAALVPLNETPLTDTCTASTRNGGGWVTDGDRHIRICYYDLTLRA